MMFFCVLMIYLFGIWPMRVFISASFANWLDAHEGTLPRLRVLVMRSNNVASVLAAAWPITMFATYVVMAHVFVTSYRKASTPRT